MCGPTTTTTSPKKSSDATTTAGLNRNTTTTRRKSRSTTTNATLQPPSPSSTSSDDATAAASEPPPQPQQQRLLSLLPPPPCYELLDRSTCSSNPRLLIRESSSTSLSEAGLYITTGSLTSFAVVIFSLYFPFWLAPWAAKETYHFASYDYDPDSSHFDNSLATYGTDYFLATCMLLLIRSISVRHDVSYTLAWRSRGLLACYLLSVTAGGLAHQFYTTLESRNTLSFRALWTCCVGTVTAASLFMGSIATELIRYDAAVCCKSRSIPRAARLSTVSLGGGGPLVSLPFELPLIPEWFWVAYGTVVTGACIVGILSFQRPACDIFVAGTTQFPSTFYVMAVMMVGLKNIRVPAWTRVVGVIGFILNAPLLPMYPLLVQYTDLSLGAVNTLLHTWLLVAWGLQGLALRRIEQAMVEQQQQLQRED